MHDQRNLTQDAVLRAQIAMANTFAAAPDAAEAHAVREEVRGHRETVGLKPCPGSKS